MPADSPAGTEGTPDQSTATMDAAGTATAKYSRHAITVVVACGCLIAVINFGVRASFGLFIGPISGANGWGRDVFALALAVQNLLWGAA